MAAQPSPNAMKTQAAMFRLLSNHFDVDAGRYEKDWGDARIAKETGLSVALVAQFRDAGFGEIKEAPEIAGLRADVRALEQLAREHHETIKNEITALSFRIAKVTGEGGR